jgi:hypothetical protein
VGERNHAIYLENLVHHLDQIGVEKKGISCIFKEPEWFNVDLNNNSLCDLIILLRNNTCFGVELKGSKSKRYKATEQLKQGKLFSELHFPNYIYTHGVFAVYLYHANYYHDIITI